MKENNICKFVSDKSGTELTADVFVYETKNTESGKEQFAFTDIVMLVTSGGGTIKVNGRTEAVSRGDLLFIFTGQHYTVTGAEGFNYLYISYYGSRAARLYERLGISPARFLFRGQEHIIPVWMEALIKANSKNIDLLCESMLLYAFSDLAQEEQNSKIPLIRQYVDEHCRECGFSLRSAAAELGYNEKYLSHLFREKLGITFSQYVRNERMRFAVLLIEQRVTSVKNVALLCGYADALYFSTVFTSVYGVSPKEFIARRNAPQG